MKHHGIYAAIFLSLALVGVSAVSAEGDPPWAGNISPAQLAEQERQEQLSAISEDRTGTILAIVLKWQIFADSRGLDAYWTEEFTAALNNASDKQLLAIQKAKTYSKIQAVLQGRSTPLVPEGLQEPMKLSDLTNDLVFSPVVPCRFFDTRNDTDGAKPPAGGNPGSVMDYYVHGSDALLKPQGHTAGTGCTAPQGEPSAIALNLTVVPQGKGHLRVWPYSSTQPEASFINYNTPVDSNLANAGIVATAYLLGQDISVSTWFGTAHSLGDVMGYFYPADTVPGIEYVNFSSTTIIPADCGTWTTLASLSVSSGDDGDGYVACDADLMTDFQPGDNGIASGAWSSSATGSPNYPPMLHSSPAGGWAPWSASWVFTKTPGTHTYYLRANKCLDTESVTMYLQSAKCVYYPLGR